MGSASATPLGVQPLQLPDFSASFISVNYDGAGNLTASGFPQQLTLTGIAGDYDVISGTWDLTATLNPLTGALISGSLSITGTISSGPSPGTCTGPQCGPGGGNTGYVGVPTTGPLLTGNMVAFGFPDGASPPTPTLEFIWDSLGGDLAFLYPTGVVRGILNGSGFGGDWLDPFSAPFSATANVPEPGVTGLLLMGFCWLAVRRR